MNWELIVAFNRAKYFNKKVIIEYRYANNSIYQGNIHYIEADSLKDFYKSMNDANQQISHAKIYEEVA
jgi:hypothetical protein